MSFCLPVEIWSACYFKPDLPIKSAAGGNRVPCLLGRRGMFRHRTDVFLLARSKPRRAYDDLALFKGLVFPGSIAKGSSSKSGCQLHLPTSHANFSRVTSPANFSCQLFESYFICQLLMPTFRELLHLPTSHANFSRVTSPANFSCQLFESYFTSQLLMSTFRVLSHYPKNTS